MYTAGHKATCGKVIGVHRSSAQVFDHKRFRPDHRFLCGLQPGREWSISGSKRLIDVLFSVLVLTVFSLPMLGIALLIMLTSEGPAIFIQRRVGMEGRPFRIYKFRSMVVRTSEKTNATLTKTGDKRITGLGYWLRKFKLDELPQFYNILRGDMSLVGPRPKLAQYAEPLTLRYRPGITGAATLAFRSEEEILKQVHPGHMDHFYLRRIKPLKERIDLRYMQRATLWSDLALIVQTIRVSFVPARIPSTFRKLDRAVFSEGAPIAKPVSNTGRSVRVEGDRELVIAK